MSHDIDRLFSKHSKLYKQTRPTYPREVFECIVSNTSTCDRVWDCGAGNGQASIGLSEYFKEVYASDVSQEQGLISELPENVVFDVFPSEQTLYQSDFFDVVVIAQSLHWFEQSKFWAEVKRVLKTDGLVVILSYAWWSVNAKVDKIIETELMPLLEPYWAPNNKHCWNNYADLEIPISLIETPEIYLKRNWSPSEYIDFLKGWSASQRYIEINGESIFNLILQRILPYYGLISKKATTTTRLNFIIGKIDKI